ncbi:MAG: DegV family protein [Tyzzerella sp.]|nr:DegV family protein [Tyzzerella sp.]
MKIRIVADSSADLFTAEDRSIVSVPLKIVTDVKEYVDDENLDVKAMTDELAAYNGRSGSACPGTGDWLAAFGDADWVFGVAITSNLSGSYNAARVAKEEYETEYPERRVYIVDSLSAGPELGLIVEKLQEFIASGMEFDAICEAIEKYRESTYLLFALKSLKNLVNNGRVSPAVAKIAGILGIQVIGKASAQGDLEQTDKVRGDRKVLGVLVKNMKKLGYVGGKVRINHCFNEEAAKGLKELIKEEFANADIKIGKARGLCSFYAEQGGMLIGFES